MKTKHTPGPWHVSETEGDKPKFYIKWNKRQALAIVPKLTNYKSEQEANARLIAAAPELLDFIQRLTTEDFRETAPAWYEDAIKLIAKATGGDK